MRSASTTVARTLAGFSVVRRAATAKASDLLFARTTFVVVTVQYFDLLLDIVVISFFVLCVRSFDLVMISYSRDFNPSTYFPLRFCYGLGSGFRHNSRPHSIRTRGVRRSDADSTTDQILPD